MINILSRAKESGKSSESADSAKIKEMDLRLRALENKILLHAEELQERIFSSLDRIEERLEDEILPSSVNPLDRLGGSPVSSSAGDALSDFSKTISLTHKHLDALSKSITLMRGQISKGWACLLRGHQLTITGHKKAHPIFL